MINNILLALFMSCSFRTANIQPNPIDYEYIFGVNAVQGNHINFSFERESGSKYKGLDMAGNYRYFTSYITYKEANDIDAQSFGAIYPLGNISIGGALNSRRWNNGAPVALIKYEAEYIGLSLEAGARRRIFKCELKTKHYIDKRVFIEPMLIYNVYDYDNDYNSFAQVRIRLGYEFNK